MVPNRSSETTNQHGQKEAAFALDHLIIASESLEAGARYVEDKFGAKPQTGGQHLGHGTHNLLMSVGSGAYLEIISPDPTQPEPDKPRPFGLDGTSLRERIAVRPRLIHYVMRCADLSGKLGSIGYALAKPALMTRGSLAWELAINTVPDGIGVQPLPSLIDWGKHPSPGHTLPPSGVALNAIHACGPAIQCESLKMMTCERRLTVSERTSPMLAAEFQTPDGWAIVD